MEVNNSKQLIAVLCNYRLDGNRIGGMDYFFWAFNSYIKNQKEYDLTWVFPNKVKFGFYKDMNIQDTDNHSIESYFVKKVRQENKRYEVVICHFLEICTPFYKELNKTDKVAKIIVVDHNPRPLSGYTFSKKLKKRLKGLLFRKYIDSFIGVSEYTKMELIKDFGNGISKKAEVIYNGIVIDQIKTKDIKIRGTRFLVDSHLRESKGIQDLIRAVALLSPDIREDLVIDIYGSGPYENVIKQLTLDSGIEKNFSFFGSVSNLNKVYHLYDYLIHPTHME